VMAGGAFAQFMLDDLEHGGNEHYLENYWYYYVSDDMDLLETAAKADYKALITNAGPGDAYGPMSFTAQKVIDLPPIQQEIATGKSINLGQYVAAMNYTGLVDGVSSAGTQVYPVMGMGFSITNNDNRGYGSAFNGVNWIEFDMWTEEDISVFFKVETIENSPTGPFTPKQQFGTKPFNPNSTCTPTADEEKKPIHKGCNPANAYAKLIPVDVKGWSTYKIEIQNITDWSHANIKAGDPITKAYEAKGWGKAGDLAQDGHWGWAFNFRKENVIKFAWQINGDKNTGVNSGTLLIDNIRLGGNFNYVPEDQCAVVWTMLRDRKRARTSSLILRAPARARMS